VHGLHLTIAAAAAPAAAGQLQPTDPACSAAVHLAACRLQGSVQQQQQQQQQEDLQVLSPGSPLQAQQQQQQQGRRLLLRQPGLHLLLC
jgi:predicted secreted Zn-dependent protease